LFLQRFSLFFLCSPKVFSSPFFGRTKTGVQPSADILAKMANVLGVSSDFLTNGSTEELAENTLNDKELLNQFKAIEKMPDNDKNIVKTLIDAFITKRKVQQLAS